MLTFKEYIRESTSTTPGNYVAVGVSDLPTRYVSALPGEISTDPHITLMYSPTTNIKPEYINKILSRYMLANTHVQVIGASVFDTSDPEFGCLVLEIADTRLTDIHNALKRLGCIPTYPEYKPHCTLIYGVPRAQAELVIRDIHAEIARGGIFLRCTDWRNEPIKND